jgi:hypothetical protein
MEQQQTHTYANSMENGNGFTNDKAQYAEEVQPQQQQQQQQQPMIQARQGNNYPTATPIPSLQQLPAPRRLPRLRRARNDNHQS